MVSQALLVQGQAEVSQGWRNLNETLNWLNLLHAPSDESRQRDNKLEGPDVCDHASSGPSEACAAYADRMIARSSSVCLLVTTRGSHCLLLSIQYAKR